MATQMSPTAHAKLTDELKHLTTVGRADIAKRIEEARALGDLSENGDYHAAKDEQGMMETRIRQLQGMLEDAEIVAAEDDGVVRVGTKVGISFEGDDELERYYVGGIEEDTEGLDVVSPNSPMGKALLGRKVGDSVSYQAPTGATISIKIVSTEV